MEESQFVLERNKQDGIPTSYNRRLLKNWRQVTARNRLNVPSLYHHETLHVILSAVHRDDLGTGRWRGRYTFIARSLIPRGVIDCPPKEAFVCICIEAGFTTKQLLLEAVIRICYSDFAGREYDGIVFLSPRWGIFIPVSGIPPPRYFVGLQKGSTLRSCNLHTATWIKTGRASPISITVIFIAAFPNVYSLQLALLMGYRRLDRSRCCAKL